MGAKVPLNYFRIPKEVPATSNLLMAERKSGDVAKGDVVRITGIRSDGKISVELPNGNPSDHWHALDAFVMAKLEGANDNEAH